MNVFIDDAYWKPASANSVLDLGLHAGQSFTEHELEKLALQLDIGLVQQAAIDLLSYRSRTRHELQQKLAQRLDKRTKLPAYEPEAIERGLQILQDKGYINDENHARLLCRDAQARGYGPGRARQKMTAAGIDRDMAQDILDEEYPDEAQSTVMNALLRRHESLTHDQRRRLTAQLVRKGFAYSAIKEALDLIDVAETDGKSNAEQTVDSASLKALIARKYPRLDTDLKERQKALAALARRGCSFQQAREIIDDIIESAD